MNDLQKKVITVGGIDKREAQTKAGKPFTVFTLKDENNNKYKFYKEKVNGDETVAYQAYKEGRVMPELKVGITYSEEDKEFTNKEGKNVKYKDRRIAMFSPADEVEEFTQLEKNAELNADDIAF